MRMLLSPDENRSQDEPEIAASIGEQMLHMTCKFYQDPSGRELGMFVPEYLPEMQF